MLDKIHDQYILPADAHLVDVGCGKGRILFYAQHKENITVTGIEVNAATFNDLTFDTPTAKAASLTPSVHRWDS